MDSVLAAIIIEKTHLAKFEFEEFLKQSISEENFEAISGAISEENSEAISEAISEENLYNHWLVSPAVEWLIEHAEME